VHIMLNVALKDILPFNCHYSSVTVSVCFSYCFWILLCPVFCWPLVMATCKLATVLEIRNADVSCFVSGFPKQSASEPIKGHCYVALYYNAVS